MQEEIWKSITGYDGLYEVSNLGRIKALPRREYCLSRRGKGFYRVKAEHIRKTYLNSKFKYEVVILTDEKGNKKHFKVSRLVALEFLPNPNNYPDVIHLKEKTNNKVENLKWGTDFDSGTISINLGNRISRKIKCIETGMIYRNANEIYRVLGFYYTAIHHACKGRYKTSNGYHWEYVD